MTPIAKTLSEALLAAKTPEEKERLIEKALSEQVGRSAEAASLSVERSTREIREIESRVPSLMVG